MSSGTTEAHGTFLWSATRRWRLGTFLSPNKPFVQKPVTIRNVRWLVDREARQAPSACQMSRTELGWGRQEAPGSDIGPGASAPLEMGPAGLTPKIKQMRKMFPVLSPT